MGLKVQLESVLNGSETAAGMTIAMVDYGPLKLKGTKGDCVAFKVEQTPLSTSTFAQLKREKKRRRRAGVKQYKWTRKRRVNEELRTVNIEHYLRSLKTPSRD